MSLALDRKTPATDARLAPRFRTLTIGGVRRAFRLEGAFWAAIAAIAERNRRTLAAEIGARLAGAPDEANHSGVLRAGVASDLLDLWETAEASAAKPQWARVVQAIPSPAFAATGSGRMLALNEAMRGLLAKRGLPDTALSKAPAVAVELAAGAIFQANRASREAPVVCNAVFRAGEARAVARVRIVLADAGQDQARLIIGFPEG
jgi:predicted DNA-binding ribbon-helix-helix protein